MIRGGSGPSYLMPSGAKFDTISRMYVADDNAITSGTLSLSCISLPVGVLINNISFFSATAINTPLNQWFGIFDNAFNRLRLTADDTTTAWTSGTYKTLALTSSYTTTYSGLYYVGILCTFSSSFELLSSNVYGNPFSNSTPTLGGDSSTGLTNPASCPATVTSPSNMLAVMYAYVS